MAKKSSTYKRTKKAPKWQLPLLIVLVLVAVGFGIFFVFFSKAGTTSPQVYLTTDNNSSYASIPDRNGFTFGTNGDKIIACDWDGTGGATVAAYRPSNSNFYISNSNSNSSGNSSLNFQLGDANSNDRPLCGNWYFSPDSKATAAIFRNGTFYLAKSNINGGNNPEPVNIGANAGDVPLACDWNGDGKTDLGYFRPTEGKFYLYLWYGTWTQIASFEYGIKGLTDYPVCGNWDGSPTVAGQSNFATVGVYRTTDATFYLRNSNTSGIADIKTPYGVPSDKFVPVVGNWLGGNKTYIGAYRPGNNAPSAPTNLKVNSASTSGISLSWNAASDDGGIKGYSIYRNGVWWKNTDTTATTYTDTRDLAAGKSYSYYVVAYDSTGTTGPQSNTVSASITAVQTSSPPPTTSTGQQAGSISAPTAGIRNFNDTCALYNQTVKNAVNILNKNLTLYNGIWPTNKFINEWSVEWNRAALNPLDLSNIYNQAEAIKYPSRLRYESGVGQLNNKTVANCNNISFSTLDSLVIQASSLKNTMNSMTATLNTRF